MASIKKNGKRRFWFACYRDSNGKQHTKSTKVLVSPVGHSPKERATQAATNERLALQIALKLEETERGNVTVAQLRKVVDDIAARVLQQQVEYKSVRVYLNGWLEGVQKFKSKGTYDRYRLPIKSFLDTLGQRGDAAMADITSDDVQRYVKLRMDDGRTESTVATDLKILNAPFRAAFRKGLILTNPIAAIDHKPSETQEDRLPFEMSEVKSLLKFASSEWKTAILISAFTGARLGDVVSLKWSNLDLENKVLKFRPKKTENRESGKKDLVIPLHADLENHLLDMPSGKPSDLLCPGLAKLRSGGRSGLSRQFGEIMARAGIDPMPIQKVEGNGRVFNQKTFHSLRHTFITGLLNSGSDIVARKKLGGHSNDEISINYSHPNHELLKKSIHSLPSLGGDK